MFKLMYNVALVIIGILLFGLSFYFNRALFGFVRKTRLSRRWRSLLMLQVFFVLGYFGFAYWLAFGGDTASMRLFETAVSLVFFFGAVFVLMTMTLIRSTVIDLSKEKEEIQRLQSEKSLFFKDKEAELEKRVSERTEELKSKVAELDEMNKLMIGREMKMIELKKEIRELKSSRPSPQS